MWTTGRASPSWHKNPAQQITHDTSPHREMKISSEGWEKRKRKVTKCAADQQGKYWYGRDERRREWPQWNGHWPWCISVRESRQCVEARWNEGHVWERFETRRSFQEKNNNKQQQQQQKQASKPFQTIKMRGWIRGSLKVCSVILSPMLSPVVHGWPVEMSLI